MHGNVSDAKPSSIEDTRSSGSDLAKRHKRQTNLVVPLGIRFGREPYGGTSLRAYISSKLSELRQVSCDSTCKADIPPKEGGSSAEDFKEQTRVYRDQRKVALAPPVPNTGIAHVSVHET